jgi:hypothetical protein
MPNSSGSCVIRHMIGFMWDVLLVTTADPRKYSGNAWPQARNTSHYCHGFNRDTVSWAAYIAAGFVAAPTGTASVTVCLRRTLRC